MDRDTRINIHSGMGAIAHGSGVAFRVWAPNAEAVSVVGDFNGWDTAADQMAREDGGTWYANLPTAEPGQEYKFQIIGPHGPVLRIDPYALAVTNSVGNGIIVAPHQGPDDGFRHPDWNALVIYEMHVGTFHRSDPETIGTFGDAIARFNHLKALGINAIQIMPSAEFAGDLSWGYNPAHIFAIETAYGGPDAFRAFVAEAHKSGFAVILDVVYNHFGPSDLDLWRFDGWGDADKGGIYFYNDWRAATPWGATRPDYGRPEVRQFIRDNALFWLGRYGVDGLRFDMTLYIRNVSGDEGDPAQDLPDGWSLMQWLNSEIAEHFPGRITIAEDLRDKDAITAPVENGGAGFGAQWDAKFVHPVREALIAPNDEGRSIEAVAQAIAHSYNGDAFRRVIYTESHDEVANGKARVPHEIDGDGQTGWAAQKRSTLGAALVFTAAGIPMIFQGQEFLQGDWFDDSVPLDWDRREDFRGIVRLYRDLIALRLEHEGPARGLCGHRTNFLMVDDARKVIAFRRYHNDEDDGVVVVLNFSGQDLGDLTIAFPALGTWRLRLNSDWPGYSRDFGGYESADVEAQDSDTEGAATGRLGLGAYTALIYSR